MIGYFDYFFFTFGIVFLLLAIVLWVRSSKNKEESIFNWKILAIFFALFGLTKFINVFFISFNDSILLEIVYHTALYSAFLSLFEFSRRAFKKVFSWFPGSWIYLALLIAIILIFFIDFIDEFSFLKVFLVFGASLLAGIIILRQFFKAKNNKFLLFLGLSLIFNFANIYFFVFDVSFLFDFLNNWNFFDGSCLFLDFFNFIMVVITISISWFNRGIFNKNNNNNINGDDGDYITKIHHDVVFYLILVAIIGGFFGTYLRGRTIDSYIKEKLLFQAIKISQEIDYNDIKDLSFTSDDQYTPQFRRVSSYLKSYARFVGLRSVYTTALVNGDIVFGPESLEEGDIFYSPPGTVYEEPKTYDYEIFQNGQPFVIGPYSDEYGTFISAASPIFNPKNKEVAMILGIDIEASVWNSKIAQSKLILLLFIFLLIFIILISSFILSSRKANIINKNKKLLYYSEGFLVGLIGIFFTSFIVFLITDSERRASLKNFYQIADSQVSSISRSLKDINNFQLNNLANFFENSEYISRQEFSSFSGSILNSSVARFFEWNPCVSRNNLSLYGEMAKKDGIEDFYIFELNESSVRVGVSERDFYYPIFYIEPYLENKSVVGFDIGSEDLRKDSIFNALESGASIATNPIYLIHDINPIKGTRVSLPIFTNNISNSNPFAQSMCALDDGRILVGFVSSVFYYQDILLEALARFQSDNFFSQITFSQILSSGDLETLASWPEEEVVSTIDKIDFFNIKLDFLAFYPLFNFGKTYIAVVYPSHGLFGFNHYYIVWIFAIFGLLLSISLAILVGFLGARKLILEEQVKIKTSQLKKSEEKFKSYISQAPDGICVLDKKGEFISFNKAFLLIFNYLEDNIIGPKKFHEFIYPEDRVRLKKYFSNVIKRGNNTDQFRYITKKDDKIKYINLSSVLLDDNFILVFIKDITDVKEVDIAKTEFISLASHQLKTPLSTVNWYSEMLLDGENGKLNKNQKEFTLEIYQSNKRMIELVNSLLNISRLELGTFIFESELLDFTDITKDVIREYKQKSSEKKIKIITQFDKDLPRIKSDTKIIRIILENLISNAIKYSPDGKIVNVDVYSDIGRKHINIKVTDRGFGIQKDQQDKIFNKLFRSDNIKSKGVEGTGLGLYIVKMIVDKLGGKINFESEENQGTTFHVSLPV